MLGSRRRRPVLSLFAVATGIAASVALVFLPVYSSGSTLSEVNGRSILLWLILPPVLLIVIHLGSDLVAVASLVLLAAFVFVSGFSIGFFYSLPLALAGLSVLASDAGRRLRGRASGASQIASSKRAEIPEISRHQGGSHSTMTADNAGTSVSGDLGE